VAAGDHPGLAGLDGAGAFAAINQSNIKRLMAYSSIGHVGFTLMGLAVGGENGLRGVLIYIGHLRRHDHRRLRRADRDAPAGQGGRGRGRPRRAGPHRSADGAVHGRCSCSRWRASRRSPGFFAKLYVLLPAVEQGYWTLATVAVVSSVVSAYYYLRIVKVMYFDAAAPGFDVRPAGVTVVLAGTGLFTTFFFLFPRRCWPRPGRRWRH
jgi:NADH-quinone oxidoreductase subunit N